MAGADFAFVRGLRNGLGMSLYLWAVIVTAVCRYF